MTEKDICKVVNFDIFRDKKRVKTKAIRISH